ncbi:MAG: extensin family protein, partial [Erythrobacter sp.]
MARSAKKRRISPRVGQFRAERRLTLLAILGIIVFAGWSWLQAHPQHNPLAPLDLRDPIGKASATKLLALRDDVTECRAVLERSEVAFAALDPAGEGACARPDRTQLTSYPIAPSSPPVPCPVAAAMELWRAKTLEPAAREIFGTDLQRIEHLGAYSCRRLYGRAG